MILLIIGVIVQVNNLAIFQMTGRFGILTRTCDRAHVCLFTTPASTCAPSDEWRALQVNIIRSKSGRTLGNLDVEVREKFNESRCEDSYAIGPVIGKGGFATVRRGTSTVSLCPVKVADVCCSVSISVCGVLTAAAS